MANNSENESDNDNVHGQLVEQGSGLVEEVRVLKQQLAEMYQAWVNGQAPPSLPIGPSDNLHNVSVATQVPISITSNPLYQPGFSPSFNLPTIPSTSIPRPPIAPLRNDPPTIPIVHTFTVPQPALAQKSNNDPQLDAHDAQHYSPELTLKVPDSYKHTPHNVFPIEIEKPEKNMEQEEMTRKMKSLEQTMRNIQGLGGHKSVSFNDLCMFPHVHLPPGFKTPKFDKYDGHGDPVAHLKRYCNQLRGAGGKEELLMAYFGESLIGIASEWFIDEDISHWHVWNDMAQDFVQQFQYNIDIVPDRSSLVNIKKKPAESFREYAIKWREQAARVKPPMKEAEMIDYFLQAQDPDYLHYMLAAIGKPFAEAIKIGEIVENGMKSSKIVSQAALKATTQAIQSGSGNFGNRKKKEEGSMMASGFGGVQRGITPSYVQFQQGLSNSLQHYYPPQGPRYSVPLQQYTVFNAQAYARPPNHQQWRAPIPQGSRQLRPNFEAPYNPHPRQEYVREQEPKKEFTPIGESYTSLFRKLMQLKLIEPIMPCYVNPNSKGFDSNARCEYHSNTQGHSTENCWTLKKAIENLIDAKAIVVTNNEDTPNITNNPLPTHDNRHFIGMICDDRDYKQSGKTEMVVRTIGSEPKVIVSPPQLAPLMVKGANSSLNLACSEKTILYVPGSTKKVEVQLGGPKLYIPGGIQKIIPNNGLRNITEPVMIRPVAQLLVTNTKAIPWNYNKTVMTYKGKEIVEETSEMGGLTRSGRCYSPEELIKAKQARESHLPISLLSLLLYSEEHRRVLIKTLNEAYVSEKTTVNQLEKMVERFFEVNRITFSDDDLPEEGAGHNRALHLMVKCEGHYVKGVMIDGGSSVDVCPLSTLQQLNIDTNRIRISNVSIRAFDGSKRDTIGEIELTMTIGPVDFNIVFQVLDMETSYNFLLGRPWIHMARAVPSILHQMVKFECDGQEIIIHGEDDSSVYKDPSIPYIEAKEGCESIIYQAFELIEVDQVEEGKPILHPRLSATSMMVA
ncbi:uncharacterized protein LOC142169778 [Nicotiana tabacum]|uniref:Uncharacterized protein LOC142169778 n=1 Tax=Nicotiana tabacum TaxID=4097 RepID=A0AC58SS30_TOBAC